MKIALKSTPKGNSYCRLTRSAKVLGLKTQQVAVIYLGLLTVDKHRIFDSVKHFHTLS